MDEPGTALFFLLLNKTKFITWSLHSQNRCKSILEQQIEFHLQKSISLALLKAVSKCEFKLFLKESSQLLNSVLFDSKKSTAVQQSFLMRVKF